MPMTTKITPIAENHHSNGFCVISKTVTYGIVAPSTTHVSLIKGGVGMLGGCGVTRPRKCWGQNVHQIPSGEAPHFVDSGVCLMTLGRHCALLWARVRSRCHGVCRVIRYSGTGTR